jgi:hypothetical protein
MTFKTLCNQARRTHYRFDNNSEPIPNASQGDAKRKTVEVEDLMSANTMSPLAGTVRVELIRTKKLLLRCDGAAGHKVASLLDAIEALVGAIEAVAETCDPAVYFSRLLDGLSTANDELIVVLEKLDAIENRELEKPEAVYEYRP